MSRSAQHLYQSSCSLSLLKSELGTVLQEPDVKKCQGGDFQRSEPPGSVVFRGSKVGGFLLVR